MLRDNSEFRAWVRRLGDELNRIGPDVGGAAQERYRERFVRATESKPELFDAAYRRRGPAYAATGALRGRSLPVRT